MQTNSRPKPETRTHKSERVPILLSDEERATLAQLAQSEQRSNASMARIIYLTGLIQIREKNRAAIGL